MFTTNTIVYRDRYDHVEYTKQLCLVSTRLQQLPTNVVYVLCYSVYTCKCFFYENVPKHISILYFNIGKHSDAFLKCHITAFVMKIKILCESWLLWSDNIKYNWTIKTEF